MNNRDLPTMGVVLGIIAFTTSIALLSLGLKFAGVMVAASGVVFSSISLLIVIAKERRNDKS